MKEDFVVGADTGTPVDDGDYQGAVQAYWQTQQADAAHLPKHFYSWIRGKQ